MLIVGHKKGTYQYLLGSYGRFYFYYCCIISLNSSFLEVCFGTRFTIRRGDRRVSPWANWVYPDFLVFSSMEFESPELLIFPFFPAVVPNAAEKPETPQLKRMIVFYNWYKWKWKYTHVLLRIMYSRASRAFLILTVVASPLSRTRTWAAYPDSVFRLPFSTNQDEIKRWDGPTKIFQVKPSRDSFLGIPFKPYSPQNPNTDGMS